MRPPPAALPEIPEPRIGAEGPLDTMSGCNQRLLRHCATLRRLVLYLGECGCDGQAQGAIERLLFFFDRVAPQHHAAEEQELFPALIESMAGSDAVCLHEITAGLALEHRELQRLWLRLRPALQDVFVGRTDSLPVREVESFIERCQACVAREAGDLLPMASRLLTDDQLEAVAEGMRMRNRQQPPA